jgi:hypothetical protein
MELQQKKDSQKELELVLEHVKIETKYEKESTDRLEQGLEISYEKIPKRT